MIALSKLNASAFLSKGFRPFFIGSALFAIASMLLWGLIYFFQLPLRFGNLTPFQWHAHSMIFGYSTAVIAGFLLTAVTNWTDEETLTGIPLLILFTLWLFARLTWAVMPYEPLLFGLLDIAFLLMLYYAVARAIIRARQWRQLAIVSKLLIIILAYILFFLGAMGIVSGGANYGIYLALIAEIALILTIARRVFPFFAKVGLGLQTTPYSPIWIDRSSIIFMLVWLVMFLFFVDSPFTALISFLISIVLAVRLFYWHLPGLWGISLLWSLYLSIAIIAMGFMMLSLAYFESRLHYFGIHALAYGGLGLITFSMMCRVALGHTGRNVNKKYKLLDLALVSFVLGVALRVLLPLLLPDLARVSMIASQALWIFSYVVYVWFFYPVLTQKNFVMPILKDNREVRE